MAAEFETFGYGVEHDWNGGTNRVMFLDETSAIQYATRFHGVWFNLYREVGCTVKPLDVTTESADNAGSLDTERAVIVPNAPQNESNTQSFRCQNPTIFSSLIDLYS